MLKSIFNIKYSQKGAVFGIDARIALVIMSIASLAIAANRISLDESRKIQESTFRILKLEEHIMQQYALYHDGIDVLETIYSESATDQSKFWAKNSELALDPWGNQWVFKVFSSQTDNVKAFGQAIVPKCIMIFSAGADAKHHLANNYTASNYAQCLANTSLPTADTYSEQSDDLFYKFTTINYEIETNKEVEARLERVQMALMNYQQAAQNNRIKYCNDLSTAAANADAKCDVDSSGTYTESELLNVNYLPKSSLDLTVGAKYGETTAYDYKVIANRKAFLNEIGLPESYNEDPLGRALYYHSNSTGVTVPQFIAEFKYEKCATCAFD